MCIGPRAGCSELSLVIADINFKTLNFSNRRTFRPIRTILPTFYLWNQWVPSKSDIIKHLKEDLACNGEVLGSLIFYLRWWLVSAVDFPYIVYVMSKVKYFRTSQTKLSRFFTRQEYCCLATFLKLKIHNNQHWQDENQTFLESKARWANRPAWPL